MGRDNPSSSCGCPLPDGCWGRQGWHFTIWSSLRNHRPLEGSTTPEQKAEWKRIEAETYAGKWLAYERCQAYWRSAHMNRKFELL